MSGSEFGKRLIEQFETLPERLGGHVGLSLAALAVGILISVPLGIWAAKRPRVEKISLTLASIIQTVPSLALLAIMVFAWGTIGWIPAWIALILYSILPMLRNTITGLHGIDPAYLEAARGVGMNPKQSLFQVELPLALPSIVAGIRTASVWVVGAATLAQPVGATSLGNYIFIGLQTLNFVAMLFGCVCSALLALLFDWLLQVLEVSARQRNLTMASAVAVAFAALAISPFLLNQLGNSQGGLTAIRRHGGEEVDSVPFIIGSKPFTEQYILMETLKQQLIEKGMQVETRGGMGSAVVLNALETGAIDCYIDYTGTIWSNQMNRTDVSSPAEILIDVSTYLKKEKQVICLGSLGFSNEYAFAMPEAKAAELGIADLHDLAKKAGNLRVGGDIEFFGRPEWTEVKRRYGLNVDREVPMDATLMYSAVSNQEVDVIVGYTTDARLDAYNLRAITDPEYALPPYDAILLVSERMARDRAALDVLRPLIQSIDTPLMRRINGIVDVSRKTTREAATALLSEL